MDGIQLSTSFLILALTLTLTLILALTLTLTLALALALTLIPILTQTSGEDTCQLQARSEDPLSQDKAVLCASRALLHPEYHAGAGHHHGG